MLSFPQELPLAAASSVGEVWGCISGRFPDAGDGCGAGGADDVFLAAADVRFPAVRRFAPSSSLFFHSGT